MSPMICVVLSSCAIVLPGIVTSICFTQWVGGNMGWVVAILGVKPLPWDRGCPGLIPKASTVATSKLETRGMQATRPARVRGKT